MRKDILKKKQADLNVEVFVPSKPPKVRKQEAQITEIRVDLSSSSDNESGDIERNENVFKNDEDNLRDQER